MIQPHRSGSPNLREARCRGCSRRREVFELDGTDIALCRTCVVNQVELAVELGASWIEWWHAHRSGHAAGTPGCPWCEAGIAS